MFTDQRMVGHEETGGKAGTYLIVGPDSPVKDGPDVIRMPSNDVWLLARTFVAGVADLDAARAVQSGIVVEPVDKRVTPRLFTTLAPPEMEPRSFLALTNEVLGRSPGHPQVARAAQFADKGIVPGDLSVLDDLPLTVRAAWDAWLPRSLDMLRKGLTRSQDKPGWNAPPLILGDYGDNDLVRAAIALIGFGALKARDARYFRTETDAAGDPLTGDAVYRMVIPPAGVPVKAFWSLSVYQPDADGRLFFFKVPIDRHSINSGSSDLVRRADGSIVLHLSRERPGEKDVVWVPTPEGPFEAIFRTYRPEQSVIDGSWNVPPLNKRG